MLAIDPHSKVAVAGSAERKATPVQQLVVAVVFRRSKRAAGGGAGEAKVAEAEAQVSKGRRYIASLRAGECAR